METVELVSGHSLSITSLSVLINAPSELHKVLSSHHYIQKLYSISLEYASSPTISLKYEYIALLAVLWRGWLDIYYSSDVYLY